MTGSHEVEGSNPSRSTNPTNTIESTNSPSPFRVPLATDLIKRVGPRGDYMLTEHTISRLRGDEFLAPHVSVRSSRATWEAAGRKDTYQMARDKVRQLSKTAGRPLDPKRAAKLAEIVRGLS